MKRLLIRLAIFLLPSYAVSAHAATQIYIPSTSTYQGSSSVINIASGTIRNIHASTFTVTNFVVTNSTATNLKVSSLTVTNESVQNSQLGAVTSTAPWALSGLVTSSTEIVTLGTTTVMNVSSLTVTNSIAINTYGIAGKPDAPISIYSDATKFASRPGIDIDVKNTSQSRIPVGVFTNRSGPSADRGTGLFFYGQMLDGTDIQEGGLAFSQNATTSTAKAETYLRAGSGSSPNSDSIVVIQTLGQGTTGYSQTLFGPPYMTPGSTDHFESDSGDVDSGIRIERGNIKTNASRYDYFIDTSGNLLTRETDMSAGTYGVKVSTSGEVSLKGSKTANPMTFTGNYGEILSSSTVTTSTFGATGTYRDVVSTGVSSGNWLAQGCIEASLNGATFTDWTVAISSFAGNDGTSLTLGVNRLSYLPPTSASNSTGCVPPTPFFVNNSTTTIYLKENASFSVATPKAQGATLRVWRPN